jgi:hypothetical protein
MPNGQESQYKLADTQHVFFVATPARLVRSQHCSPPQHSKKFSKSRLIGCKISEHKVFAKYVRAITRHVVT